MLYSFDGATAPERHELQYFEMFGNRGIYHKGWSAVTRHSTPWVVEKLAGPRGNEFSGRVKGVQFSIVHAAKNSDHLVSPAEAVRIAMARQ